MAVPPPQRNYDEAAARAVAAVRAQPAEQLEWLGASPAGQGWTIAVLNEIWTVELDGGVVCDSAGRSVGPWWRVLTLHYLGVSSQPAQEPPTVTFADLPGGRGYASVYQQRVIGRLCRTVGRDGGTLRQAGQALGGSILRGDAPAGDLTMEFQVYPRLRVRLAWYAGDDELSPSAAMLLPANIESFFCLEDIVVLSERLVARLAAGGERKPRG
jgi:hypothetical protein